MDVTRADLIHGLQVERARVTRAYENRCRPAPGYGHHPSEFDRDRLEQGIRSRLRALQNVRERRSICNREGRVVRLVFKQNEETALRVARCESGLYRYAVGAAGERGIFQVHPVHFGTVDENRLWNPLYSSQLAWRWSDHGTNFSPTWTCATNLGIP